MSDRLRVALVAEHLLGEVPDGYRTYVRGLMTALPRAGIQVEPVVAWHRPSALREAGLVHARRLRSPRGRTLARWSRGRGPEAVGDADLVHAPTPLHPPRGDRPLVITVHDVFMLTRGAEGPEAEIHRRFTARVAAADLVLVPSKATEQAVEGLPEPPERVRVVPHGTDLEAPEPEDRDRVLERLEVERPYVLWLGRVEERKNPEGVVRGFVHAVSGNVPRADRLNLYLVGPPGWWRSEVGEFLEERGMTHRVRRLGVQPRHVLPALYAGAEAFVFPSFEEGFGLPVLEAMACGAPVVTSNRSSLPEVCGSAGLLCDPDDPVSIGDTLTKLLRDRELAEDLRRLGLRRAAEFTWQHTAEQTAAAYRELLEGAGEPAAAP